MAERKKVSGINVSFKKDKINPKRVFVKFSIGKGIPSKTFLSNKKVREQVDGYRRYLKRTNHPDILMKNPYLGVFSLRFEYRESKNKEAVGVLHWEKFFPFADAAAKTYFRDLGIASLLELRTLMVLGGKEFFSHYSLIEHSVGLRTVSRKRQEMLSKRGHSIEPVILKDGKKVIQYSRKEAIDLLRKKIKRNSLLRNSNKEEFKRKRRQKGIKEPKKKKPAGTTELKGAVRRIRLM